MKFALLVVGRTVEKHYITAINDYVERIKHYTPFDMEVIPELKNTKSLSMEQQKEKEGELILKAPQPGDVVVRLMNTARNSAPSNLPNGPKKRCIPSTNGSFSSSEALTDSQRMYMLPHRKRSLSRK